MYFATVVVPIHGNANVTVASPIGTDFVVFLQDSLEMEGMFFADIFYSKIVDNKSEGDGASFVGPQSRD